MVPAAGAVFDLQLGRVRERVLEQGLKRLSRHASDTSHAD
jgi:hypothetical protein